MARACGRAGAPWRIARAWGGQDPWEDGQGLGRAGSLGGWQGPGEGRVSGRMARSWGGQGPWGDGRGLGRAGSLGRWSGPGEGRVPGKMVRAGGGGGGLVEVGPWGEGVRLRGGC
jgi:hypothetical protein